METIKDKLPFLTIKTTNERKPYILWLFILALGVALGWYIFSDSGKEIIKTITTIDTIYQDTGTHTINMEPYPVYVLHHDTMWRTLDIDTNKILEDYFASYGYADTVVNDSSMLIAYTAVVSRNQLQGIQFDYANRRATTIHTTTNIIKQRPRFYLGAAVGGNADRFDVAPFVGFQKGHMLYYGEYGIFNKDIRFGAAFGF